MKIIHICLACFYIEGMGYQENILPKEHHDLGYDVTVITSDFSFNSRGEITSKAEREYVNKDGVNVKVITRKRDKSLFSKFNKFDGLYNELLKIRPDIVFVHGGQFVSLKDVIRYIKNNSGTKMYIDQHGDFYNMPISNMKSKIVQKFIYGHYIRSSIKYCSKFWGVTPWRCQYLHDVYGVPLKKIGLLVMGGDDEYIHFDKKASIRNEVRRNLNLSDNDFVVVTGGKIDETKNIHLLMQAISEINKENLKLIVFGQPNKEMSDLILKLSGDKHIRNIGWIDSFAVYDYFMASDLAVFPGTHSVLWEQAAACGIPMIVKNWKGMHHVDVGGNCLFLYNDSIEEIKDVIVGVLENKEEYNTMLKVATEKGTAVFSYKEIAKRAIEI